MKSIIQVLELDVVVLGQVYIGERRTATGNLSIDAVDDVCVWGGGVSCLGRRVETMILDSGNFLLVISAIFLTASEVLLHSE